MEPKRETFLSPDGVTLEGFLFEPIESESAKGIILSIGGSGISNGGFGGPAAFCRFAQANSFIAFEWNKRGIRSNSALTDTILNRAEYDSTTIDKLLIDAQSALSFIVSKFPNLPVFVFGGSEGSYVTTLLAQSRPQDIRAIATFGTGIAPFIEIIEHQITDQLLGTYCKENNIQPDHQFSFQDLSLIAKANEDFLPIISALFPHLESQAKSFSLAEVKNAMTKYWLLDVPNRDEVWFSTSASPKGYFEAMIRVPSMFDRIEKYGGPTLILQGVLDESAPVQYAYQFETVCKLRELNNYFFKFYSDAGHAPNKDMIVEALSFFQTIADQSDPIN